MKNVTLLHNTFTTLWKRVFCALAAGSTLLTSLPVSALDFADATVTHGDVTGQTQGLVTDINQTSQAGIINWGQFNIGAQETVNFNQPNINAITLNRVVGGDLTAIAGALNANGNVWVVNNAGVFVQQGAQINVGGMFLAAAMSIEDSDFLAGKAKFSDKEGLGVVVNAGTINAGKVALLGGAVINAGEIAAPNAALVAGKAIELDNNVAGGRISISFDASLFENHVVENVGKISATTAEGNGGTVALKGYHVGNYGEIHADGTTGQGGDVVLQAAGTTVVAPGSVTTANAGLNGDGGTVWLLGNTLIAPEGATLAARGGRVSGNGGFIETSGYANFIIETLPDVSAEHGTAGTWLIDPYNIEIVSGPAYTQYSDSHLNGFSNVGAGNGDYAWNGSSYVYVGAGNGSYEPFYDAHDNFYPIYNMNNNNDAAGHEHGSTWSSTWSSYVDYWLADNGSSSVTYGLKDFFATGSASKISAEYISQALSGGSTVRIMTGMTGSAGAEAGNITVSGAINNSSGTLELIAANDIIINNAITVNVLDLITGGNVSQSLSGIITANTLDLNVTGNVILNQANAIQNVQGAVGGDLNLRTTTALGQGDVLSVGLQTTLQSEGAITLNNANNDFGGALSVVGTAGNDVAIQDQNDLTLGSIANMDDLTLVASENVVFTGTVAADAITVRADSSITQVDGAVITATSMDVGGATVGAVQRVDLSAAENAIGAVSGDVSASLRVRNGNTALTIGNAFTVSEDLVFTTGSDLTLAAAQQAGSISATAGGLLTAQGALIAIAGDITLAADGSIVAADDLLSVNGSVIVTTGDKVRFDGDVGASLNVEVLAMGLDDTLGGVSALTVNGILHADSGDVSLMARGPVSSIYVSNSDTIFYPTIYSQIGNVVLDATGDIVADGTVETYNHLVMSADRALTVGADAGVRAYHGNVTLTTLRGDITLGSGSTIIAQEGNVALTTQDGDLVGGDGLLFYGAYGITLSTLGQVLSDGNIMLGDHVWMETSLYDIIINANGSVTIGTGTVKSGGDLAITAGHGLVGDLSADSDLIAAGDVRLHASGSIHQSGTIIADAMATGAGHTIAVIADTGSITMTPAAQSQFGTLAQGSGSILYQTGSVVGNLAGGDITLGTLNAGTLGSVLVAADVAGVNGSGAMIKSAAANGSVLNVRAAEAELTASRAVGETGNHLQTSVDTLAARADGNTASDGIYVDEDNGLTVKSVGSTDGLKARNGAANVVVDVKKGALTVQSGGTPAVQAGGNVRLATLDQDDAGGSITLAQGADVRAGGNIAVIASGLVGVSDIHQNADLTADSGSILVSTANGSIVMDAQAVSTTAAAQQNIAYHASQDIVLGQLIAGAAGVKDTLSADSKSVIADGTRGDVALVAQQGSIVNAGADNNITARDLRMEAGAAVGTGAQHIETAVDRVAASAGAGGVYVSELDNVRVDQINPVAVNQVNSDGTTAAQNIGAVLNGVNAVASIGFTDGSIVLDAADTVIVNQSMLAANNLRVTTSAHDVRTVAALSAGDNVTVLAQRDVEQLAGNGDITAATGTIDVEAGRDILMSNGRVSETHAGDIRYVAGRDVQLGQVIANAGAADVYVEATAGEIRDAKSVSITTDSNTGFATDSSRSSANVVANKLTMKAAGNVGAIDGIGTVNPIDTTVNFLTAKSANGSIAVLERDSMTIGMQQTAVNDAVNGVAVNRVKSDGTAGTGDVTGTDVQGVTAYNNVTVESGVDSSGDLLVNARVTSEQGNALLASQQGTLTLNEQIVAADTAATKGAISILASGTIYQYSDAFVAGRLAAANGSITAGNTIDVQSFGGSILMDDGTVSTTLRTDETADIRYVADVDVQVGQLIAGKTVTTVHDPLTHTDSDVVSGAADAFIRAIGGAITDAKLNDVVTTDANTGLAIVNPALRTSENVVARKLTTSSGTSTGSGINPLDTQVGYYSGGTANGALHLIETDGLQVGTYVAQSSYGFDDFVNDLNKAQNDVVVNRVQTQDATLAVRTGDDCIGVGTRHGDLTIEVLTGDLAVRSSVATRYGNILLAAQNGAIVLDAAVGTPVGAVNYNASVLASGDIYQHYNDARSLSINGADELLNDSAYLLNNGNIFMPGNVDVQSFAGNIYMDYANAEALYEGETMAFSLSNIRYKAAGDIWLAGLSSMGLGSKIAVDAGGSIVDAQGYGRVRNLADNGFDVMAGHENRLVLGARQDYVVYDRFGFAVNDAFNNDPTVAQRVNIVAAEVILKAGGTIGHVIDQGLTHGVNPLDAIDVKMLPLTAGGDAGNITASGQTVALFAQDNAGDMRLGPVQNLVINRVTTRDGVIGGGNVSIDDTVLTAARASGDFTATMSSRDIAGLDTVPGHQAAPVYGFQDRILATDAAYLVANHNIIDANDAFEVILDDQHVEHLIKRTNIEAQSIVFTVGNIAGAADDGNTVNPLEVKVTGNAYTDQLFLNNSSQVDADKINYALIETLDDIGTADPQVQGEHYPHGGGMEFSGGSIFVNSQFMGGDPLFIHSESAVLAPIGAVIDRFTPNNAVWKGTFAFMTDELGETAQQTGVIVLPAVGSTDILSTEFPMQIRSKQLQKGSSPDDEKKANQEDPVPVKSDKAAVLDVTTYDVASL